MGTEFRRAFKIQVGDVEISSAGAAALRCVFSVERDTQPYPNAATLAIYNLNPDHRAALNAKPELSCRIEAGYVDAAQQIFLGNVRRGRTTRSGPDWITTLEAGDGEKQLATARVNVSFTTGTPVTTVLTYLASALGLPFSLASVFASAATNAGKTLRAPLTLSGSAAEELRQFTRSVGLSWSVQDGALVVLANAEPYTQIEGPVISPATGLIESASLEVDDKTKKTIVTGKALLLPDLVPGRKFVVESSTVNGTFACTKTKHYGDSSGAEWFVDFEGVAL
jgi:hypothetical protein